MEWKESWRDEYLRWLCGFANADGRTLIIGMNDKGEPVGADDADRLLVDLPNKIRDMLGIVVPVRALTKKGKDLVEISYRGVARRETFPVPRDALREALLNALIHKDYSSGKPIQIRVETDSLSIFNSGPLPPSWTAATCSGSTTPSRTTPTSQAPSSAPGSSRRGAVATSASSKPAVNRVPPSRRSSPTAMGSESSGRG
ncbi:MAG TPA: RNA-binding domain-containing protein [Polyangiaceae bacterium]